MQKLSECTGCVKGKGQKYLGLCEIVEASEVLMSGISFSCQCVVCPLCYHYHPSQLLPDFCSELPTPVVFKETLRGLWQNWLLFLCLQKAADQSRITDWSPMLLALQADFLGMQFDFPGSSPQATPIPSSFDKF